MATCSCVTESPGRKHKLRRHGHGIHFEAPEEARVEAPAARKPHTVGSDPQQLNHRKLGGPRVSLPLQPPPERRTVDYIEAMRTAALEAKLRLISAQRELSALKCTAFLQDLEKSKFKSGKKALCGKNDSRSSLSDGEVSDFRSILDSGTRRGERASTSDRFPERVTEQLFTKTASGSVSLGSSCSCACQMEAQTHRLAETGSPVCCLGVKEPSLQEFLSPKTRRSERHLGRILSLDY